MRRLQRYSDVEEALLRRQTRLHRFPAFGAADTTTDSATAIGYHPNGQFQRDAGCGVDHLRCLFDRHVRAKFRVFIHGCRKLFGYAARRTFPRESMVSADISVSDTLSPGALYATFYHTGSALDLIQYGLSDTVTLYINDAFVARYGGALISGTAQGGSMTGLILSSTSSNVSGYYNEYYVRIAGGTGVLNETRQITAYDAASLTATVASPWTMVPDNTTQYVIQDGTQPFVLDGSTGSIKYIHLNWEQSGQRKITVEQGIFAGVAADGPIAPAPPWSASPSLVVGDSFWEGEAAPINTPRLIDTFAMSMGCLPSNLAEGGTGYIATSLNRLNFQDRIAPRLNPGGCAIMLQEALIQSKSL